MLVPQQTKLDALLTEVFERELKSLSIAASDIFIREEHVLVIPVSSLTSLTLCCRERCWQENSKTIIFERMLCSESLAILDITYISHSILVPYFYSGFRFHAAYKASG